MPWKRCNLDLYVDDVSIRPSIFACAQLKPSLAAGDQNMPPHGKAGNLMIVEENQMELSRLLCLIHQFPLVLQCKPDILYTQVDSTLSDFHFLPRSLARKRSRAKRSQNRENTFNDNDHIHNPDFLYKKYRDEPCFEHTL